MKYLLLNNDIVPKDTKTNVNIKLYILRKERSSSTYYKTRKCNSYEQFANSK